MMHGDIDHNEWRSWRTDTTHLPNLNFYVFDWHPLVGVDKFSLSETVGHIMDPKRFSEIKLSSCGLKNKNYFSLLSPNNA